jgi:hypothetical protein
MKPFCHRGEVLGEKAFQAFEAPACRLSLLGLAGGGGGGLGLSASASSGNTAAASGGGGITVNNGSSGPLSTQTWLIIGGVALFVVLIFAIFFNGRRK